MQDGSWWSLSLSLIPTQGSGRPCLAVAGAGGKVVLLGAVEQTGQSVSERRERERERERSVHLYTEP